MACPEPGYRTMGSADSQLEGSTCGEEPCSHERALDQDDVSMRGWLVPEFPDPALEAAFQEECLRKTGRRGALVAVALAAIGAGFLLATMWWPGTDATHFLRKHVLLDVFALSTLALTFNRAPEATSRLYNPVLLALSLHWIVEVTMTADRVPPYVQLGQHTWHPSLREATGGLLISGSLVAVIVFARPSLRLCLLYINIAIPLYTSLALAYGLLEHDRADGVRTQVCCIADVLGRVAVLLYLTAALLYFARRDEEQRERRHFAVFFATRQRLQAERQRNCELQDRQRELAQLSMALAHGPCSDSAQMPMERKGGNSRKLSKLPCLPPRQLTVPIPANVLCPSGNGAGQDQASKAPRGKPKAEAPNAHLAEAMAGRQADMSRITRMAERMRHPQYMLPEFFEDCVASFPELSLFFLEAAGAEKDARPTPSGRASEDEYQRTVGALFAVYWLVRLEMDGSLSFCYGVDEQWLPDIPVESGAASRRRRKSSQTQLKAATDDFPRSMQFGSPVMRSMSEMSSYEHSSACLRSRRHSASPNALRKMARAGSLPCDRRDSKDMPELVPLPTRPFFKMSNEEKRASFLDTMDWSMLESLVHAAGCSPMNLHCQQRLVTLLCLTAIHDVMKVPLIQPVVQPEHAPYCGHAAGDQIRDHDIALSYILEHFPDLMPSFAWLPASERRAIIFTQSKLQFNHGWFVQAEAPPGAMLSGFKAALGARVDAHDIGLYFLHWITDLAGAEATPLGGAEKFVLKFPHAVLASFLWSMPFLGRLKEASETEVVEEYLLARWRALAADIDPPMGRDAIARLRLAVMAQGDLRTDDAFKLLSAMDQDCLAAELACTGSMGQRYARRITGDGGDDDSRGGPAFLVYYGPALLQKFVESPAEDMRAALHVFAEVLREARELWPLDEAAEGTTVTVQIGALKALGLKAIVAAPSGPLRKLWVLERHNDLEGSVELARASHLQGLIARGSSFRVIDFCPE